MLPLELDLLLLTELEDRLLLEDLLLRTDDLLLRLWTDDSSLLSRPNPPSFQLAVNCGFMGGGRMGAALS